MIGSVTHIHHRVDLSDCFIVCGELIDLHTVADQLAHYLYLELVQLALGDGVCFGNNWNDIHLQQKEGRKNNQVSSSQASSSVGSVGARGVTQVLPPWLLYIL